jgi:hypothetical protein
MCQQTCEVDVGELLSAVVLDDKAGVQFFDRPGWWEAAIRHKII